MPEIQHRGRRVTFREAGAGRPGTPVLLAHCSLAHSGLWKPIMEALSADRHVIAPDMPAHGGSEPPPEGESLQLHAVGACEALAARFGRPAHFVGLSLGGAVLGRLALARPDLAASATLIEPVWFHLLREAGRHAEADEQAEMTPAIDARIAEGDWLGGARVFVDAWGAPGGFDALGPEGRAYAARCLPHLRADFDMVSGRPPGQIGLADVARLAPPALLVSGERSPRSAPALLDAIREVLPSARRAVIAGAGHLSPVTHWREVLALLEDFMASTEEARV